MWRCMRTLAPSSGVADTGVTGPRSCRRRSGGNGHTDSLAGEPCGSKNAPEACSERVVAGEAARSLGSKALGALPRSTFGDALLRMGEYWRSYVVATACDPFRIAL